MIETARLTIVPLSLDQLRLHLENSTRLEDLLGLLPGQREVVEPLLSIITHFTVPRLKDPELDPLYHTLWIAWDRETRQIVADAKFKGEPDETGTVEIGYGTYPAFQQRGYMTEMVGGMVNWVSRQPGVLRVMADTDVDNLPSQRVLQKNGFTFLEEIEGLIWWEWKRVDLLQFDEFGFLLPIGVTPASLHTVGYYFGTQNKHRKKIWGECVNFLTVITEESIPVKSIWIDGSFVTTIDKPNDIDIVIFVSKSYLDYRFQFLNSVSQRFVNLDVKWVPFYGNPDLLKKAIDELEELKWFTLFSSSRRGKEKGFLRLTNEQYGTF